MFRLIVSFLSFSFAIAIQLQADALTFPDGEKISGTFIRKEKGLIIFQSKNLGNISVPEKAVILEVDEVVAPPLSELAVDTEDETDDDRPASALGTIFSFGKIIEKGIVGWWEPWKGRIAASLNVINDTSERAEYLVEARATREYQRDTLQAEGRYEYRKQDNNLTSDQVRLFGTWRHRFSERYFSIYRPEMIRDRLNSAAVQPFPDLLLKQQIGVGAAVYRRKWTEVRIGAAEVFFNVWSLADDETSTARAESAFVEADFKLPWRITATNRAIWYFPSRGGELGWENEFEFTKKVTDSLSVGIRQEYRRNNPDIRVQDYERLRLLLGYDF